MFYYNSHVVTDGGLVIFRLILKSKDFHLLSQQDVIDFLSFLAVEKKVSASSQNQAFNALLFLFRNVLKKDFGEIRGVARAKRKPYIPKPLLKRVDNLVRAGYGGRGAGGFKGEEGGL